MTKRILIAALALGSRLHGQAETAPALAVCRVEKVRQVNPAGQWEAELTVHRVFFRGAARPFEPGDRITVRYAPYKGPYSGSTGLPDWPQFEEGAVALFPLRPAKGAWELVGGEIHNPVVPALAQEPQSGDPPRRGETFLLKEVTQVLVRGEPEQRVKAVSYLRRSMEVPAELPGSLAQALGRDDDAWLETGCAFLAVLAQPRVDIAALVYGQGSPPFGWLPQLATWILWKGDRRDYPNRLIRRLIRHADVYEFGAANVLVLFKDSETMVRELSAALRRNSPGAMTIAWWLAKEGQRATVPEAVALAQRMVGEPAVLSMSRLHAGAELIRDYGDDRQFGMLVAALLRMKREDEVRYGLLWQASAPANPRQRNLRLAAVLIDDRRGLGGLRYCDSAASVVQGLSGVDFGIRREMTPAQRDRAVELAAEWLRSHGVSAK